MHKLDYSINNAQTQTLSIPPQKGTLSILDKKGTARTGLLYDINGIQDVRTYTVENILNHLEYQTNVYYSNKTDSTSSLNSSRAINGMEDGLYRAENGANEQDTQVAQNTEKIIGIGGTVVGVGVAGAGTLIAEGTKDFGLNLVGRWASSKVSSFAGPIGITIAATTAGTAVGLAIGDEIVKANKEKFTNSDGTFNSGKAGWFKTMTALAGGFTGFAAGGSSLLGVHSLWALVGTGVTCLAAWAIYEFM